MGISYHLHTIKQHYREIFQSAHQQLLELFERLRANYSCPRCDGSAIQVDASLHEGCPFREWQKEVILNLEQVVGKRIVETLEEIQRARAIKGKCLMCGACCSLSSSEFDYETLLQKAQDGDSFAQQFTSVFQPYESHEAAYAKFPELVKQMLEQADGDVHFYHCPHLSNENRCTIYQDPRRPPICSDYPEMPLVLMHRGCGYQSWKEEALPDALLAHASLELCQYYVHRIYDALKNPLPESL